MQEFFDLSRIDSSWGDFFRSEANKDYFVALEEFLSLEYSIKTIFPKKEQIFRAFELTPLNELKVVILGQDPYHEKNQAEGLAFSASFSLSTPKSLNNIFKEVQNEYKATACAQNSLVEWAKQGVLLLNTTMTVEEHKPLSHFAKGWEIFTDNVLSYIARNTQCISYMLWGANARSKKDLIKQNSTSKDFLIIENVHPSPLSARKGFFNSNMFRSVNEYLLLHNKKTIIW